MPISSAFYFVVLQQGRKKTQPKYSNFLSILFHEAAAQTQTTESKLMDHCDDDNNRSLKKGSQNVAEIFKISMALYIVELQ